MTATGIGILGNTYLNTFFESYSECVKALAKESTRDALLEEIVTYEDMDGINILTDARHATRKNSKYTDVICLGLTPAECCTTRLWQGVMICARRDRNHWAHREYMTTFKVKKMAVYTSVCTVMMEMHL